MSHMPAGPIGCVGGDIGQDASDDNEANGGALQARTSVGHVRVRAQERHQRTCGNAALYIERTHWLKISSIRADSCIIIRSKLARDGAPTAARLPPPRRRRIHGAVDCRESQHLNLTHVFEAAGAMDSCWIVRYAETALP